MGDVWYINKNVTTGESMLVTSVYFDEEVKISCLNPFKLLDEHGEVLFSGYCSSDSSYDPLDLYGADHGSMNIAYWDARTGNFEIQ